LSAIGEPAGSFARVFLDLEAALGRGLAGAALGNKSPAKCEDDNRRNRERKSHWREVEQRERATLRLLPHGRDE